MAIGLLALVAGIIAVAVHGSALSVRFEGSRVTATVHSCQGENHHDKYGDHHRTECDGDWRLPGDTVSTGPIEGAAEVIGAVAEDEDTVDVERRVEVWATDTEALVVQRDPIGWLWFGGLLIVVGVAVLVGIGVVARRRRGGDY